MSQTPQMDDMKYDVLKDYFKIKGLDERFIIMESDLWFYNDILKNNPDQFFHLVFAKDLDPETQKITVNRLIINIVNTLNDLETKIQKLKALEEGIEVKGKALHDALDHINEMEDDYDHQGQKFSFTQDTIGVCYTISERNTFGVFNQRHPLTYKVGTAYSDLKTIHDENAQAVSNFKVEATTNSLIIKIYAIINNVETEVSTKNLPLEEVYTAHSPKVFSYKEIPPAYLIIPYDADAGIVESKEVELKFEFNLTFELRVKILRTLIVANESQRVKRSQQRADATRRLDDLLAPFESVLGYKTESGFFKNRKGGRACDSCNLI